MRLARTGLVTALLLLFCVPALAAGAPSGPRTVLQPVDSPLVSFRLVFMTGAASDPAGKEGVAALTASLLSDGGSKAMTYDQIVEAMYPMATSFNSQVDKEMTVFSGTTHIDNLDAYYGIIRQMLLDPGFREDDFKRIKENQINYLKVSLRGGNDEELGKEALYAEIYRGTPYGHVNQGRVSSLEALTIDDVKTFYKANYTQANLRIGLAGGLPKGFATRVEKDFAVLPAGSPEPVALPKPKLDPGTKITIIERPTRSTAISIGFPIDVTRADADWPALAVVASYFGQHRSSNSYLYQRLREARGLNYGDYAYIEYFPRGMFQFEPDPNLGRRQQIFQIWIRPVEPQNGQFALRAALYEFDKLVRDGMSKEAFEATCAFLEKNASLLTSTQDTRLGYALDSNYYGIPEYAPYMRAQVAKLTLDDVNRAIRKYLASNAVRIVMVTKDGAALKDAIVANAPSPITYNSPKPDLIMQEDKTIEVYPIKVKADDVTVVKVDSVFQ